MMHIKGQSLFSYVKISSAADVVIDALTFTTLWTKSADGKLVIFFIFPTK